MDSITDERMLLQLVLSIGYSPDPKVYQSIIRAAKEHSDIRWMPDAIMTCVNERSVQMLMHLLENSGSTGKLMLDQLSASIASRGNVMEIQNMLMAIRNSKSSIAQALALKGINRNIKAIKLNKRSEDILNSLIEVNDLGVRGQAIVLSGKLKLGNSTALNAIRKKASADVANASLPTEERLAAVTLLSDAPDKFVSTSLIDAWPTATPPVKSAILDAMISQKSRHEPLIQAIENDAIKINELTPTQRTIILERSDGNLRPRVEIAFAKAVDPDKNEIHTTYAKALLNDRNVQHGQVLFKQMCASCHRINEIGISVGPDLKLAYKRAEETLLRDILFPSESISSGYETYFVTTTDGQELSGVLVSESANNVVLRQAGGTEHTFMRKEIKNFTSLPVSLMPAGFGSALNGQDCADIISFMKESLLIKN